MHSGPSGGLDQGFSQAAFGACHAANAAMLRSMARADSNGRDLAILPLK